MILGRLEPGFWGRSPPREGSILSHYPTLEHVMGAEVRIGSVSDFPDGGLAAVEADGHRLIVAREGNEVHVARNRCPHLGFSLTRGPGGMRFADGVLQCPWHNSRFNVCTGENLDWVTGFAGRPVPKWSRSMIALGRRPRGLDTLSANVREGDIYVTVE